MSMLPPSPCIGICRVNDQGLCIGCARTAEEIAGWRAAPGEVTERIWAALPARRQRLGLALHRLGWSAEDISSFTMATLSQRWGSWVFGVGRALAEFSLIGEAAADCRRIGRTVTAVTARGAIRFDITDHARVMVIAGAAGGVATVALVVPRANGPPQARFFVPGNERRVQLRVAWPEAAPSLGIPDVYAVSGLFNPAEAARAAVNAACRDVTRFGSGH
jgi:predicted Fe-S protein YdhL (DUF1289 family)